VLTPISPSATAEKWETHSSYRKMLLELVKSMMNNKVPDGFGYKAINNTDWSRVFNGSGKMQLKAIWSGEHVVGLQYLFYNDSNRTLIVPESAFYHHGVLLVATTEQRLEKHTYESVYEIVDRGDMHE